MEHPSKRKPRGNAKGKSKSMNESGSEAILRLRLFSTNNRSMDLSLEDLARNLRTTSSVETTMSTPCRDLPMTEMVQRVQQQCSRVMSRNANLTLSLPSVESRPATPETLPSMIPQSCPVLWGCRERPFVRLPPHIRIADPVDLNGAVDYSMMLKILWDDYHTNKYKYIAATVAMILTSALDITEYNISSTDRTKNQHLSEFSLYRMHLTDIGVLLQKEALKNVTLDIHLKLLKEEDVRLSSLFYHEEISPYFILLPSIFHRSEILLTLNTDRICEDTRKKLLFNLRNLSLESRFTHAVSVLDQAGLTHQISSS